MDVAGERRGVAIEPDGVDAGVLGAGDVGGEAVADHGGVVGVAAELPESALHGARIRLADADFAGDDDGPEVGPDAGGVDLEVLKVGSAVGDEGEGEALG